MQVNLFCFSAPRQHGKVSSKIQQLLNTLKVCTVLNQDLLRYVSILNPEEIKNH